MHRQVELSGDLAIRHAVPLAQDKNGALQGWKRDEHAFYSKLHEWLERQHVFFVATAPLAPGGLVNCSPKGMDTFRISGPREVAYLDLTGSGVETIAHLRENRRIVFLFIVSTNRLFERGVLPKP